MSLGKDLASLRKSKNLSLEDIQAAIKIPPDTLKSIEDESIFSDSSMNKTYVRSFVRSYGKLLKIPDAEIVSALDALDAGTYSGELVGGSDESSRSSVSHEELEIVEEKAPKKELNKAPKADSPKKTKPDPSPGVESINWADMGRKFTIVTKSRRVWVPVVIFVVIGLTIGAGFYFWNDISSAMGNEQPAEQAEVEQTDDPVMSSPTTVFTDTTSLNEELEMDSEPTTPPVNEPSNSPSEPIELDDTLTLSLYAAYGQLEPVRVTSDLNWTTNPFWMEEGEAYYFDFKDTLLIRGQYSRMLVLFNGHVIENPRQNYFNNSFNSIMITRSVLDQPKYLAPAPPEFPLSVGPPDSTIYRIRL